ncbi:hypothetical protein CH292_17805 [Rhodococcus sp. 14-2470-1a]|nr:hypothetical protein CH292_17805 [Rhodococcus sp. 14-2470-1a]
MKMKESLDIRATIGARTVSRQRVLEWESARATKVLTTFAAKLGERAMRELSPNQSVQQLLSTNLAEQRSALTRLKYELGHAGIYAALRREMAVSERLTRIGVAASRGRTRHAVTRLQVPGADAERSVEWFDNLTVTNAETDMLDACPDHYLLRGLPGGRQEVIETTGGSPAASRFLVDYTRTASLTIEIDHDYPIQVAGSAVLDDGLVIGGVRHQFRNVNGNLDAVLTVQFPGTTPARLIAEHQWHLACEFSNWIEAAHRSVAT